MLMNKGVITVANDPQFVTRASLQRDAQMYVHTYIIYIQVFTDFWHVHFPA
jgi:hypothetical protein